MIGTYRINRKIYKDERMSGKLISVLSCANNVKNLKRKLQHVEIDKSSCNFSLWKQNHLQEAHVGMLSILCQVSESNRRKKITKYQVKYKVYPSQSPWNSNFRMRMIIVQPEKCSWLLICRISHTKCCWWLI